jgi:hypothetical protein
VSRMLQLGRFKWDGKFFGMNEQTGRPSFPSVHRDVWVLFGFFYSFLLFF